MPYSYTVSHSTTLTSHHYFHTTNYVQNHTDTHHITVTQHTYTCTNNAPVRYIITYIHYNITDEDMPVMQCVKWDDGDFGRAE